MITVRITDEAAEQAMTMDDWWRSNRLAAPSLFAREFKNAVSLLGVAPGAGQRFKRSSVPGVRRLVLPRTRNLLFYLFDRNSETVHILAVWGGPRGTDPQLRDPR